MQLRQTLLRRFSPTSSVPALHGPQMVKHGPLYSLRFAQRGAERRKMRDPSRAPEAFHAGKKTGVRLLCLTVSEAPKSWKIVSRNGFYRLSGTSLCNSSYLLGFFCASVRKFTSSIATCVQRPDYAAACRCNAVAAGCSARRGWMPRISLASFW